MNTFGQLWLLGALVGSGYAAFACTAAGQREQSPLRRTGLVAGVFSVVALTVVAGVLVWALLVGDFGFSYVRQYSSRQLPWHYALSALWVGQSGSLLLWAWLLGVLALAYRFWPRRRQSPLRQPAFGLLMGYLCFLVAVMVFGADPMQRSLGTPQDGAGLSPLLQHPAMLLHPPVVFLGYAGWAIPFALAVAALAGGRLDADWAREARPWALFSWAVLGAGILLGAEWAYEELGWGGYWGWDPVENGSLIPWLTGTAVIHTLLAWQHRRALKKTALLLTIATFALCNFATFLTRSGIFSSLHAFSESPIGWMFLGLVGVLAIGGGSLVLFRRKSLICESPTNSVWSREAMVLISTITLLLLAGVTLAGTLAVPLSDVLLGRKIAVGAAFYNNVLIPTGLVLLTATAMAPLLRWERPPTPSARRMLILAASAGAVGALLAYVLGVRHPAALGVTFSAVLAAVALAGAWILDARQQQPVRPIAAALAALRDGRRRYAAFLIHMGLVGVAVGVTGSSLGTRQHEVVLTAGETIQWAGWSIHCDELIQRELPGKLVAEARLEVSRPGDTGFTLLPAQHLHLLQNQWTTEVAIESTWGGDFYAILHGGEGQHRASFTLLQNPMIRWMWLGGLVAGVGTVIGLWPAGRRRSRPSVVPPPKGAAHRKSRKHPIEACMANARGRSPVSPEKGP